MADSLQIMKEIKKRHGDTVINKGVINQSVDRIPTGWFPFDLATGGGIPLGRISILYGAESSLKTTIALKTIASYQKRFPKRRCVFIDVENHYDPAWGKILGVKNDAMLYVLPDTAEQAVDIVQDLLKASDIGMIVFDSLAALISTNESLSSADKMVVGGTGLIVGRLYRKVTLALSQARKEGKFPIFLAINQVRFKVGVMYGDPETMPGGNAFKFASSLTVRLHGKDEVVPKIHPVMPSFKNCSGIIKKYKVPITSRIFEFKMGALTNATNGIKLGVVDDWKVLLTYLIGLGWAVKKGNKYEFNDETFPSSEALRVFICSDLKYLNHLKQSVIEQVVADNNEDMKDEVAVDTNMEEEVDEEGEEDDS